ncbi:hypothetical protein HZF08_28920 [Paenibacillus sp. CGMCC 1.16610]|uniref:Helicase XPB/Ssl2 N-terminal domain-containing protein n=1 Tax=Paenibacillus anseongense TaxID=2682845 RepID=A0ABW9UCL3_9BACL|nr:MULTISPECIES: hypothetical protein [Paenibacillus]MBA2942299.1 hypothetical protein [Paenibacillus sp. CGMCC 1.16610]MVQ36130.1 hypothetical protein [Paenibacillus anseongense]
MNLADMLSYADIHELGRIANTYECECNGHSKNELIQSILSTALRREIFEKHIQSLNLEDIRFLNSLLFDPRNAFSIEELIARVQQSRFQKDESVEWNPRDMVIKFKKLGWLFNGYSQQTKFLFHVPNDLKRKFSDVLTGQFKQSLKQTSEPNVYRDEQLLIIEDIFHFLTFLSQVQELPLTVEGSMYKRQLQQILDRMSVQEEMVSKGAWRFGYGRMFKDYPNRFSFIYDYCYYRQLISEQGQVLSLTEEGKSRLLEGKKENLADVYKFWLRLYKNPIPNVQSLAGWVDRLSGQWVTLASLSEVLCKLVKPFYYDSSESIVEQRILQMMMHLGLIRIGEDLENGMVVQATKMGSKVIQGTFVAEEDKVVLFLDQESARFKGDIK